MRTKFLCISVLRVTSGPRVKLASCKSALNPPVVYSTDHSKAVVPVLVLLFVALWFILRGDLLYVFPCVILFLCFSVLLVLRLPRLGKRELNLVLFVRLFGLCLFRFVSFLFLLVSGKGFGLWLWHSLDFSLTFFWRSSGESNKLRYEYPIWSTPGDIAIQKREIDFIKIKIVPFIKNHIDPNQMWDEDLHCLPHVQQCFFNISTSNRIDIFKF